MTKQIFSVLVLSSLFFAACKEKQPPPNPAVPVNLDTVKAQSVTYFDRYPSTTEALSQVNLLAQVQGYVTDIYFKEGAHVKKGQKLYRIDQRIYQNSYNEAADNLKVAEGNLKQAQQDADRYTYLNENRAVAKQVYDHAMITLQNARNQVRAASETLNTAKTNLNYAIITAPFDGTIGFSQVKLGNLLTIGQTVLNTISTDDPMAVDFLINEKQLNYFEDLQNGKSKEVDSLFTMIMPNGSFYKATGELSVIDRAVNPQTGSIRIRLVFPNPKNSLRAGMSCVVRVHNQDETPQILIPNKSVIEQMGEYFVYVVKDTAMASGADTASKKGPVRGLYALQKKVQTGATIGPNVVIKNGIEAGDKIVIDGVQTLHDGSLVTTANKRPADAPGRGGK